jgi:hypothetical protein
MQETDTHTFSSDQAATSFFLAKQIFKSSNVKESSTNMHEEGKKIWNLKKKQHQQTLTHQISFPNVEQRSSNTRECWLQACRYGCQTPDTI